MPENKIVKTIKLMYREDFEEKTSELITVGGYSMISALLLEEAEKSV